MKSNTLRSSCVAAAVLPVVTFLCTARAQTMGGTGPGLDSLKEDSVMNRLDQADMKSVLDRDFEVFKVPANQQAQVTTLSRMHDLSNAVGLKPAERRDLAVSVAKGLATLSPSETDSTNLVKNANELYTGGVIPTMIELEYFGENPVTQNQLKPVAETDKKMFQMAATLADKNAGAAANGLNQQTKAAKMPKIMAYRQIKFQGQYSDNMATYPLCLTLPKTDPQRKILADGAITFLKKFDDPKSTVQGQIRLQIAKLQLVSGDFDTAKKTFDTIIAKTGIVPPPTPTQENDARYFSAVSLVESGKLDEAKSASAALDTWETANYLNTLAPADQQSVLAASAMLKFRIASAASDAAENADQKKTENDKAIDVLAQLLKEQPALRDLVFDQLIGRIPATPDYASLNPLVLVALRQQGFDEVIKKDGVAFDAKRLNRAIDAAKELVKRKDQSGMDAQEASLSAYFIGYAYEKLDKQEEAANAFMDFAENFPADTVKGNDAMDHATALVGKLRKANPASARAVYDRFLPLAINAPFNRKQFAFQYAVLMQEEKKFKPAVEFFDQVPKEAKTYNDARYLEMLALSQELADTVDPLGPDDRKAAVDKILRIAAEIDGFQAAAKTPAEQAKYTEWVANADPIAADLTRRDLKDPNKSLAMLDKFEDRIKASKNFAEAKVGAQKIRINDYMDSQQMHEATALLVDLLKNDVKAGQALMFAVLDTVTREKDAAQAAGDMVATKKLAADKAELTGFVVKWSEGNADPKFKAMAPEFRLIDADSKRDAAELNDDPAAKKVALDAAKAQFTTVLATDTQNLAAQQGLGLTDFALADYAGAQQYLSPLVVGNKVGNPVNVEVVNGAEQNVENPQFWEANYELLKAILELSKQNPKPAGIADQLVASGHYLSGLFIVNGKATGGTKYKAAFEQLKADYAVAAPVVPIKSTPAPAAAAPAKK